MLARYRTSEGGRLIKTADVYTKREHGVDRNLIDPDAVKIVARLQKYDFSAYIVGGAVRDLLVGKRPKDFDIVTDAEPNQIRKLFRNSRVIGKRFRLVHIFFHDDKIIEVSTFRASEAGGFNNVYGTIEEDAWRRDFSLNALFYDPLEEKILDFTNGYRDIRVRRLKPIIPLDRIFVEDPVRMIRAIKYSVSTGCKMGFFLKRRIRSSAPLLADVSPSRISEEAFKIWQGGYSARITKELIGFGLFKYIVPRLDDLVQSDKTFAAGFFRSLGNLDYSIRQHNENHRFIQLAYLVGDYFLHVSSFAAAKKIQYAEAYYDIKDLLKPVTPPNIEVERALMYLIRKKRTYEGLGSLPVLDGTTGSEDLTAVARSSGEMQRDDRRPRGPRKQVLTDAPPGANNGNGSAEKRPKRQRRRGSRGPRTGEGQNTSVSSEAASTGGHEPAPSDGEG